MTGEAHGAVPVGLDASLPELSLVMPCYNEEAVVEATVTDLLAAFAGAGRRLELVAVDNGSRDRTGRILSALARDHPNLVVVRVEINRGYGHGLLAGLPRCRAPWVGIVCADAQVEARDVVRLFQAAAGSAGPRLLKVRRRFRRDGLRRKVVSVVYNLTTAALFGGLGSIDVNGNPKILPREWADRMRLESRDWFLDAEIMIKAKRLGLPVHEVNVPGHPRAGGASNVRASTCWEFVKNLLAYRFRGRGQVGSARPEGAGHAETAVRGRAD
jgi:glycosyltransferase involved in cell wall biosynthesis